MFGWDKESKKDNVETKEVAVEEIIVATITAEERANIVSLDEKAFAIKELVEKLTDDLAKVNSEKRLFWDELSKKYKFNNKNKLCCRPDGTIVKVEE